MSRQSYLSEIPMVLIESDWNLKERKRARIRNRRKVLIESDWNLKDNVNLPISSVSCVLIESDWNLKGTVAIRSGRNRKGINRIRLEFKADFDALVISTSLRINRIRLEFKGSKVLPEHTANWGINRIRLEFKDASGSGVGVGAGFVLIESDWNLKKP